MEFHGYDNRGRQQGNVLAYLVEAGDDRQAGKGKVFESHVVAVQDGYYDYWVEETYGAYTLERMVPLHFCASPQASCGDATMHRLHVDVFRILPLERVLLVSWLTEEDKAQGLWVTQGVQTGLAGSPDWQRRWEPLRSRAARPRQPPRRARR